MIEKKVYLKNIINFVEIQRIQDSFANLMNVALLLVDINGIPIVYRSNPYSVCENINDDEDDNDAFCNMKYSFLCKTNIETKDIAVIQCPYSKLVTIGVPLIIDDVYWGSWILRDLRIESFYFNKDNVVEYPFKPTRALIENRIEELPLFVKDSIDDLIGYLRIFGETIITLGTFGYANHRNAKELESITQMLENNLRMFQRFSDSADVGMYVSDFETGEILLSNRKFATIFNTEKKEIVGKKYNQFLSLTEKDFQEFIPETTSENSKNKKPFYKEVYIKKLSIWLKVSYRLIRWANNRPARIVTCVDITKEKQMQNDLIKIAFYDTNLGLPNRIKFMNDLKRNENKKGSLLCFDINALRHINDAYGRNRVDLLLHSISSWIKNLNIANSVLYRIEGDEFSIYLDGLSIEETLVYAELIKNRFSSPWEIVYALEKIEITCDVSICIVDAYIEPMDGDSLLNIIDRTLDQSRKTMEIASYNEELDQQFKQNLILSISLKNCVNKDMEGFSVYYQPIIDPSAGTWHGLEALCRWKSPEFGNVSPVDFIPLAEQSGFIRTIEYWMMESAIKQCKEWGIDRKKDFILDINVSAYLIMDELFVDKVLNYLNEFNYPGEKLGIEITESSEINFESDIMSKMEYLRDKNVKIILDDFGTGYSSFNNLKHLPVSILKTEKKFIDNIENDSYLQYLFHVMVELAHAANMKLVAEGVENIEQMRILLKNGADYFQGYLFGKPMDALELESNIDKFYLPDKDVYLNNMNINHGIELFSSSEAYKMTPFLYNTLSQCIQVLFNNSDINSAINETFKIIGDTFGISRINSFIQENGNVFYNANFWHAKEISYSKDISKSIDFFDSKNKWMLKFRDEEILTFSNISYLPEELSDLVIYDDVKSIVFISLMDRDGLLGYISFEDCLKFREWMPEELHMLHNLCDIITNTIRKNFLEKEFLDQKKNVSHVLQDLDALIYISDLETDEILYTNNKFREVLGNGESLEGKICYEAIYGNEERCSFCKINRIKNTGENCFWIFFNRKTGRFYKIHDEIISWKGRKKAHLQYAIEITGEEALKDFER